MDSRHSRASGLRRRPRKRLFVARFFVTTVATTTLIVTGGLGTLPPNPITQLSAQGLSNGLPPAVRAPLNDFFVQLDAPPLPEPDTFDLNSPDDFADEPSADDNSPPEEETSDPTAPETDPCPEGDLCPPATEISSEAADCPEGEVCAEPVATTDPAEAADCPPGDLCETETPGLPAEAEVEPIQTPEPGELFPTEAASDLPRATPAGNTESSPSSGGLGIEEEPPSE